MLSILAITPWLFVGFDTIPQTAEEFDFPPEKSRRLMINSIVCGALYALVLIAVAIIIPYTDLLGQNHSWTTGAVANMAFGRFGGVILAIPVMAGIFTGMNGFSWRRRASCSAWAAANSAPLVRQGAPPNTGRRPTPSCSRLA